MFRVTKCSSSGESILSIRPLVYVGDRAVCIPHGHMHRVTYVKGRIDTVDSPDDEQLVDRNM